MTVDKLVVRDVLIPLDHYPHLNQSKSLHEGIREILSFTAGEKNRL